MATVGGTNAYLSDLAVDAEFFQDTSHRFRIDRTTFPAQLRLEREMARLQEHVRALRFVMRRKQVRKSDIFTTQARSPHAQ